MSAWTFDTRFPPILCRYDINFAHRAQSSPGTVSQAETRNEELLEGPCFNVAQKERAGTVKVGSNMVPGSDLRSTGGLYATDDPYWVLECNSWLSSTDDTRIRKARENFCRIALLV